MPEQKFRHELKYLISAAQVPLLQGRLRHLLRPDIHAGAAGSYRIRSLYFDDIYDRCFYENENGTDPREKFRIRIYNGSSEKITLECKRKEHGMTQKTACPLTVEQAQSLMQGKPLASHEDMPPLLRKFELLRQTRRMHPVVIVEYDRIPYVYPNDNVRITLDTNISASTAISGFLDKSLPKRPVMPLGQQLLEVKYDAYLPDFVYRSLQLRDLQHSTFSKYYICRKLTR